MQIILDALVYDGKSFKPDDEGAATTPQGKALEKLGFTQSEVAHPRYDTALVLNHGSFGRASVGDVIASNDGEVVAVIAAGVDVATFESATKKAAAKK